LEFNIIPPRLNYGDTIGIISPSNAITDKLSEQLNKGKNFLEDLGFKVVFSSNAMSANWDYAAAPCEKVADIHQMFSDNSVKAIICSQGGDTANAVLPLINWEIIKNNPKIFMGISDNSILLNTIYKKTGLITFHGNDLAWGFSKNIFEYDGTEFIDRLVNAKIGLLKKNSEWKVIRNSPPMRGRLLGGNLRCLLKLAGTEYWPDFKDAILFIESCIITPARVDYMFEQMKQLGVFEQIKGVIIGYIYGLQTKLKGSIQMEDILLRISEEYSFPVLKINDFGHMCANTVLPVGAEVRLDSNNLHVEILDDCVF